MPILFVSGGRLLHLTEVSYMFLNLDHRLAFGIASVVLTVGVGAVANTDAHAAVVAPPRLEVAATALRPAVRLSQAGVIIFPMNPLPKCALSKTSFGQPRPPDRVHEGIDLMASLGQAIYAVGNGTITRMTINGAANSTLSGNAMYLTMPDKTYYFYAHLSAFAAGITAGSVVTQGQLIGYVGDTGDPGPGNYHLHFEVHPQGGEPVDPYPLLTIPKSCTVVA